MGNRKPTFTQAQILRALERTNGLEYLAARQLGCSAKTIERAVKKYAAVAELIRQRRAERIDVAEGMLWRAVESREPWAICFFLKTQGKHRGYSERFLPEDDLAAVRQQALAKLDRLAGMIEGALVQTLGAPPPAIDTTAEEIDEERQL